VLATVNADTSYSAELSGRLTARLSREQYVAATRGNQNPTCRSTANVWLAVANAGPTDTSHVLPVTELQSVFDRTNHRRCHATHDTVTGARFTKYLTIYRKIILSLP